MHFRHFLQTLPVLRRGPAGPLVGMLLCSLVASAAVRADVGGRQDLTRLMAEFAAMPGLVARFREEKSLALLRAPLVSHGSIYYAPPNRLARVVRSPDPSQLVVDGDRLLLATPGETRTIDLAAYPILRAFVDSLRLLLRGDLPALEEQFRVDFSRPPGEPAGRWQLELRPHQMPLSESLRKIRIAGQGRALLEFHVTDAAGDETRMSFSEVDTEHHFSDRELAEHFRSPAS